MKPIKKANPMITNRQLLEALKPYERKIDIYERIGLWLTISLVFLVFGLMAFAFIHALIKGMF